MAFARNCCEEENDCVINGGGLMCDQGEPQTTVAGFDLSSSEEKSVPVSTSEKDNSLQASKLCNGTTCSSTTNSKNSKVNSSSDIPSDYKVDDVISKEKYPLRDQFPEYINLLIEGIHICGDAGYSMDKKPEWFNESLFRRGQRVAIKYFIGLEFAEMISLFMIYSVPDGLFPLIFTGKSDTPFKAFKRYLSTVVRVRSWYTDDIWNPKTEGHKHLKIVRTMHDNVRQRLNSTRPEEMESKLALIKDCHCVCSRNGVSKPLYEKLREEFQASNPNPIPSDHLFVNYNFNRLFVNQLEMAMAQFAFIGLFILYPSKFGAHYISDKDLEGFIHLWRCIAYMLGTDDKYNICNGDLKTVKKRVCDIVNFWAKPWLRCVSYEWEHMMRCVVKGVGFYVDGADFEVSLLFLCNTLDISTPMLSASLTLKQIFLYYLIMFVFNILTRFPGVNEILSWVTGQMIKRAQNMSSSKLKKLERSVCPFGKSSDCFRPG